MLDHIIRRFSPCGTRIVVHDLNTGDVWVADLQRPGSQRDDALAMAARWEEGEQPTSPQH